MSIKENLCKNGWVDHKKTVSFTMERKSPGQRNFSVIKILFVYSEVSFIESLIQNMDFFLLQNIPGFF